MTIVVVDASGKELLRTDLPDDVVGRIDKQAARRGVSEEEMIVLLIEHGLTGAEWKPPQKDQAAS